MAIRARGEPYSLPLFRAVTLGALDSSVRTHERESRSVVVEADPSKLDVERMAPLAISTELILVNVLVAGNALGIVQEVRLGLLPRG